MEDIKNSDVTIKISEENGVKEYKILYTFRCDELDKDYLAYDSEKNDLDGNRIIMIASYNPNEDYSFLEPVTDEEELKMANDVLNNIMEG